MKRILLFTMMSMFLFACEKETKVAEGAKSVQEAELRLASAPKWVILEAFVDGKYIIKDKKVVHPDGDGSAEWLKFYNSTKKIEVKYLDGEEIGNFVYKIEGSEFLVFDPLYPDDIELYRIKAGSVFEDKFTLEAENQLYTLVKEN